MQMLLKNHLHASSGKKQKNSSSLQSIPPLSLGQIFSIIARSSGWKFLTALNVIGVLSTHIVTHVFRLHNHSLAKHCIAGVLFALSCLSSAY